MAGRKRKYSEEFRQEALERMKKATNVTALARELGIRRKWLYQWRNDAMEAAGLRKVRPPRTKTLESDRLRKQIEELLKLVGQQEAKLNFFESALRRIKERRPSSGASGATPSTTSSGQ